MPYTPDLAPLLTAGATFTSENATYVIEPQSLDPAIISAQPDMRIVSGMFEGLTRTDPKTGRAIPGLAERWDISADGRIYTFHLRTNLVWSTGDPIRAADVVYSWVRALNPMTASDYAGQLFYVKNAEAFNAGKTNAEAVAVDIEPLPVVLKPADAVKPDAPLVFDTVPNNIALDYHYGDAAKVADAFGKAKHITRLETSNQRMVVNAMEPRAAASPLTLGSLARTATSSATAVA